MLGSSEIGVSHAVDGSVRQTEAAAAHMVHSFNIVMSTPCTGRPISQNEVGEIDVERMRWGVRASERV